MPTRYTSNVTWDRPFAVTAKATDTSLFNELINEWQFVAGPVKNGTPDIALVYCW